MTLCPAIRECLFGEIIEGEVELSAAGHLAAGCWLWLAEQYPYILLDAWVVMPNHLHGIIIVDNGVKGGSRTAPTTKGRKPLGRLIGAFKTVSNKHLNDLRETLGAALWQRNYYEHIIRNEADFERIRKYIYENPARWPEDENNPANMSP